MTAVAGVNVTPAATMAAGPGIDASGQGAGPTDRAAGCRLGRPGAGIHSLGHVRDEPVTSP
jgi:hypothetical protein